MRGILIGDINAAATFFKTGFIAAVSAYIDLNAVRAGLAKKPEDYQWGSYQFYYQRNYNNGLVDCVDFLELGGEGSIESLCQDYIRFVESESKNPKRPKFIKSKKFI